MPKSAVAPRVLPVIRVLLVEDNPSDASIVNTLLEDIDQAQYRVCHVKAKLEALKLLAELSFDVCLLDLTLPDASGFSGLIHIQEKVPDMPILILTGLNDTALAKKTVGRGAQDYLLKDELETTSLVRSIDYAMERKRIEKNLFERANHDALTGLANRIMFENSLSMAMARTERIGGQVAILFIDLDRFKPVNDQYGHDAGDEVLKTISTRMKKTLRPYDTPARFGGDEFAVLLEGIANPRDAATIAQKIIAAIRLPIPFHGKNIELGASIGIAFSTATNSQKELMQNADVAMYYAKREGGNAYRFYAQDMHNVAQSRLRMEENLQHALAGNELRLYYQPYILPRNETLVGIEALLRWEHPKLGLLRPEAFMEAAETSKMMGEISIWISTQLHRDMQLWNAHLMPPLQIAINLSASQIDDPALLDWIAPLLQKDFLGKHTLAIEIPEGMLISLSKTQREVLLQIHRMGAQLHLNNFGCHSLPLQALLSLPFSMLKIDLSLIQGIVDQLEGNLLIGASILFAHHVGLKVAGVGVEIPWQRQVLETDKCDVMQGFLIATPMPADQLVEWLAQRQSSSKPRQVKGW